MYFALLGPLQVKVQSGFKTPTAPMARRVLAVLLTHADRVVSTDLLIEELWLGRPPKLARKTVQTYVYQIRKALGDEKILETHPHGYRLRLSSGQLDLWEFQEHMTQGQNALRCGNAERAAGLFHQALELWRGASLMDLETGPVLSAQLVRLEESRLRGIELRVEADLRLGQHRALIGELKELTINYPLREEFYAQLITAAHRSGQRDEALSAYTRLRRAMVEQLGLEPSEQVKELHRAVLGDVHNDTYSEELRSTEQVTQSAIRWQLPACTADFVARESELAKIDKAVHSATTTDLVSIVAITGGLGVGKTETALRAAHELRESFPDGQLYAALHTENSHPVRPVDVLAGLLVDAGYASAELPKGIDELSRMFRDWAANRKILVMLDDAAGTNQVLPLLPGSGGCTVFITSRCKLTGLPGSVTTVAMNPVSQGEGAVMLSNIIGAQRAASEPEMVREVVRWCEGLPLAIRAAGDRLTAWPHRNITTFVDRMRDDRQRLDALRGPYVDIARQMRAASRRLPTETLRALRKMCHSGGPHIKLDTLARWFDLPLVKVEQLVESLITCHVLEVESLHGVHTLSVTPLLRLTLTQDAVLDDTKKSSKTGIEQPLIRCAVATG